MIFPINLIMTMHFQESPLATGGAKIICQVKYPNIKFKELGWLNYWHHLSLLEYKTLSKGDNNKTLKVKLQLRSD